MTMKEVEQATGMTRANIRFYEAQGLLTPARGENGYRDYSAYDLEILKRIHLLRLLRLSLEDIKALQTGEEDLLHALDRQLEVLEREKKTLSQSQAVCAQMRQDRVRYETLNAQPYLDALARELPPGESPLQQDAIPRPYIPWRRYLARTLDLSLCGLLWTVVLTLGFHVNASTYRQLQALNLIVEIVLLYLLEPLCLSRLGTTPGKWLFGLFVTDNEERRLTYGEARARTGACLWYGLGCNVPIYSLVRLWKSANAYSEGQTLPWEYDSELVLKDRKPWRAVAWGAALLAIFGLNTVCVRAGALPPHRGELTVAEFCENYNWLANYFDLDIGHVLTPEGLWTERETPGVVYMDLRDARPEFSYTLENGVLTGVSFTMAEENGTDFMGGCDAERMLTALAFGWAGENRLSWDAFVKPLREMEEDPLTDYEKTVHGIHMTWTVDYEGYFTAGNGWLIPEETGERSYAMTFTLEKEEIP